MKLRTQDEIVAAILKIKAEPYGDFFGVKISDLIVYLDYEHAKQFLIPEATAETWAKDAKELTAENVKAEMLSYMSFAWDKANHRRGLSANRSMDHFWAWTWLLGDNHLFADAMNNYRSYGKNVLVAICEHYGWDYKQWDNGDRNSETCFCTVV